jgi:hypothetical protein
MGSRTLWFVAPARRFLQLFAESGTISGFARRARFAGGLQVSSWLGRHRPQPLAHDGFPTNLNKGKEATANFRVAQNQKKN